MAALRIPDGICEEIFQFLRASGLSWSGISSSHSKFIGNLQLLTGLSVASFIFAVGDRKRIHREAAAGALACVITVDCEADPKRSRAGRNVRSLGGRNRGRGGAIADDHEAFVSQRAARVGRSVLVDLFAICVGTGEVQPTAQVGARGYGRVTPGASRGVVDLVASFGFEGGRDSVEFGTVVVATERAVIIS